MKLSSAVTLASLSFVSAIAPLNSTSSNSKSWDCSKQCKPFTIDVTYGEADGSKLVSRSAILTNGSLPGPPLKLNVGDCVDFTVINHLDAATGVHFHGIRQKDTPWSDGTPGLSQWAIKSGDSYTYRWTADEVGVYFYHSHYRAQMMDGLYGAIIISSANDTKPFSSISSDASDIAAMAKAEENVNTVLASDWNQFTAQEVLDIEKNANIDYACADSIILNGMGSSYCLSAAELAANQRPQVPQILAAQNQTLTEKGCIPASNIPIQGAAYNRTLSAVPPGAYDKCTSLDNKNYTVTVDPADKWAAMSFISPSGIALFAVTIDGHKLYVYEVNGHYITPQTVDQITLSPGDRVSFMIKLDQTPADYTIRVANDGINQVISGYGVLSYKGASGPSSAPALMNYGGVSPANSTIAALNNYGAAPFGAAPAVAALADRTFNLDIMKNPTDGESWSWVLNQDSYPQSDDDQAPLLYAGPSGVPESDLVLRTNYNEWVDLIIKIAGPLAEPHPIHKHANKFYVIGAGTGDFNYTSVAQAQAAGVKFNLANPAYVDGYTSTPAEGSGAWMVFRYQANTPGAWYLHCHVQTHFSGGMGVAILDGIDNWPTLPANPGNLCPASGGNGTTGGHGSTGGSGSNSTTTTRGGSGSGSTTTTSWGGSGSRPTTTPAKGDSGSSTTTTKGTDATTTSSAGGDIWSAWTSLTIPAGPQKTNTVTVTKTGADWSIWSSISEAVSTSTAKHGVATTILVGATPYSAPGSGGPATKNPVSGVSTSSGTATWAGWANPSSSVSPEATSIPTASSWAAWSSVSSGKPVADASTVSTWAAWGSTTSASGVAAATGSATWNTWATSATPAVATQGLAGYNGTYTPVAAYKGSATTITGGSIVLAGIVTSVLALLL